MSKRRAKGGLETAGAAVLQVTPVPLGDLVANPENTVEHSEENLARIKASLGTFGQVEPLVVQASTMRVIGGNGRLAVMRSLGWTHADIVALNVDDAQASALGVALNRATEGRTWKASDLETLLQALPDDLASATGFTAEQVRALLNGAGTNQAIEDPGPEEPPQQPVSRLGDLWVLGDHRLLCGDSTEASDVERLFAGGRPFLCVTDPPFGVNYDPQWRSDAAQAGHLAYAARRVGRVLNDDRADWSAAWALFPGDVIYSWHPAGATSLVHAAALQGSGFAIRMQIIWAKPHLPIGRGDYHVQHEPCWYAVREGRAAKRTDDRTQTTLWKIALDRNEEGGHSTQKPLECMERPIRNHHAAEVYEPFLGSGTTLIACERQRRKCYAMELNPPYVDASIRRWQRATGHEAVLDGTGLTYAATAAARGVAEHVA